MSVKSKIQALIVAANAKTGNNCSDLTAAVQSLIDGYGGGAVTPEDKTYSVSNQAIEEFVSNVDYTADYSTSSVGTYTAKPYADSGNPKGANVNVKGGTLHQLDNGNEYAKTVAEGATTIYNNTPNTVGAYSVTNDGNVVSCGKLMPSGNVRIIKCDGIVNMRDLGGWAADGGTVRHGKLFRSPALDNATTADISMMSNLLGINSELDMRESGAEGGGSGRFENYLHQPMGNYADIIATDAYKAKSKTAFEFVMNCAIQGKPCVFHCAAGADRTGTMAWVLLGVLGVSQSNCDKEYEITSFSTPTRLRTTYLPALYSAVAALDGDTFAEKCKSMLVECGIEVALINQFRHAMIDGTPTDFEDTAGMREEVLASLKACTRMKWSNSTTSGKAPTNNNGWLALATTSGDTWQFTDRESNTCYGIKIPSWATKVVVSTTDDSIIKWSFRSYLADGTAVGIADEDNTSGKYAVSNAKVIQISACYSTDGSVTPSWNYDSTKITVKFVG